MSTPTSRDDFVAYTGNDTFDFTPQSTRSSSRLNKRETIDLVTGQTILTKEGEITFDMDDLRSKLAHLRSNSHVKIRKLNGKLKEDFDSLAQHVSWIYNTDSYPLLYNEIRQYFSETDSYQPGTIGAYCGGCLGKKDGSLTRGCTVVCAGSIPPPYDDPEWNFCDDLVIWAVYNGSEYDFTTLNEVEDNTDDRAIIFVDQDSLASFPGFSDAEKKTLADHGIKQVRVVNYNADRCPAYIDITNGFVDLSQVKTRHSNPPTPPVPVTTTGWNWWMILLIILIVLALFLFFCRCSTRTY